jgi:hypothetical protein
MTEPPRQLPTGGAFLLEGKDMEKYQLNGSEFYKHFAQYETWIETLEYLIEHEHIRRKKERGRDFFRNVANDIVNGLVVSKKCASSILQDLSAAMIQPPATYEGASIIPMPADVKLLEEMSKSDKTKLRRKIGNRTRAKQKRDSGRKSVGVQQVTGTSPAGRQQVSSTDWGIDITEENGISDAPYYTLPDPTLLNYTLSDSQMGIRASHGDVSSTQVVVASHPLGESRGQQEAETPTRSGKENPISKSSHLGTKIDFGNSPDIDKIHYLRSNQKEPRILDVNDPVRNDAPNSISLENGIIARIKNRTSGQANGEYKVTLQTMADEVVYTAYLSGTDDKPFGPNRIRSNHLNEFAEAAGNLIYDGFGEVGQPCGQVLFGQFKFWRKQANKQLPLADHFAVLWIHPEQTHMNLFLVLGDQCTSSKHKLTSTYGTDKNPDLLAAAGSNMPVTPIPYSYDLFTKFFEGVADTMDRRENKAANG